MCLIFNKIILYHKTDKEMIKGYKYRLDPTPEQIVQMEKTFGCCGMSIIGLLI